jgi:hypothetical protein
MLARQVDPAFAPTCREGAAMPAPLLRQVTAAAAQIISVVCKPLISNVKNEMMRVRPRGGFIRSAAPQLKAYSTIQITCTGAGGSAGKDARQAACRDGNGMERAGKANSDFSGR